MTASSRQEFATELALASHLADLADVVSMQRFRAVDLHVERKPDLSPVTDADTRIEAMIRETVLRTRPDDLIVGEEGGSIGDPDSPWRWVVDPIDGTKSFARGNENWATLIALQYLGDTVVAVASMPALGHRYSAVRGQGAVLNGAALHVSTVERLDAAMLAHTSLSGFAWCGLDDALTSLARHCWDARGFGNSLSHLAVARGSADIGWTSRAQEWDFAALALIVEEAGGRFSDLEGHRALAGAGFSSNGGLHQAALDFLRNSGLLNNRSATTR